MFQKVHLSNDGFLAGSADSFSNSLDSQSVEVRLQASKHVIQFVGRLRGTCGGDLSLGLDLIETNGPRAASVRSDTHVHTRL